MAVLWVGWRVIHLEEGRRQLLKALEIRLDMLDLCEEEWRAIGGGVT